MIITHEKLRIVTSLSEQQVAERMKANVSNGLLALRYSGRDGFAGRLDSDRKAFEFAFVNRKARCAVVTRHYVAEGERGTTVHFDIRWPYFEVLSVILGSLASAIVPFIFSKYFFVLPMYILIGWPLVAIAFCVGSIAYYIIPGFKQARTKLIALFEPNVESVIDD